MITLTLTDVILYYIGIICAVYVGYMIGNGHNQLDKEIKSLERKTRKGGKR